MFQTVRSLPRFLYHQRIKGFDPPGDEPWMDPEGAERFKQELSRCKQYVEFGSGGTTVLADHLGVPSVSVESDRFYARAVASRLSSGSVRQVVVDLGFTGQWGAPLFNTPAKGQRYVSAPWGGKFPDLILVDGRYRIACSLESARRAFDAQREAVLLFDDYGTRPHYHLVESFLSRPEMAGRVAVFLIGNVPVLRRNVEAMLHDKR